MEHVVELMEDLIGTLSEVAQSEVVVGKEVDLGPAKIVPLSRISMGFGGGGGEGDQRHCGRKDKKAGEQAGKGIGGGGGGGVKVRPVGVIVFTDDEVRVEGIPDKKGGLDRIFDKIPEIIDLAKGSKRRA